MIGGKRCPRWRVAGRTKGNPTCNGVDLYPVRVPVALSSYRPVSWSNSSIGF